jgi:hypothetical protein
MSKACKLDSKPNKAFACIRKSTGNVQHTEALARTRHMTVCDVVANAEKQQ